MFGNSTALQKQIEKLQLDLNQANTRLNELKEENENYQQTIAAVHLSTGKYEKQVEELKSKHDAELKELNSKLKDTEKSVNRKVNKALQNIGVTEFFSEIPVAVMNTDKELYTKFVSMPNGTEKQDFFKKNEAAIKRAIGL
jgi:predicted  nucleic acid-binding Zn-ribbon protein